MFSASNQKVLHLSFCLDTKRNKKSRKHLGNCCATVTFSISCVVLRTAVPCWRSLFLGVSGGLQFEILVLFKETSFIKVDIDLGLTFEICSSQRQRQSTYSIVGCSSLEEIVSFLAMTFLF